jgi:hypothetical protein
MPRMRTSIAIFAALAAGCSINSHERIAGWPELQIVEHYVSHTEMRDRCAKYVGFGMQPEACAEFNLSQRRCDIWFSRDFPPQRWIVAHERQHCAGYDHIGSTAMQQLLERYVAANGGSHGIASAVAGSSGQ